MLKNKHKGFTLIEVIIALAIFIIIITMLYSFFLSNYKVFRSTETNVELRNEGEKAVEQLSKEAMQSSKIIELEDVNGNDILENKNEVMIKCIKFKNSDNSCKFLIEGNVLYSIKENKKKQISKYIKNVNVKSIGSEVFKEAAGINIIINLQMHKEQESISTRVEFRNHGEGE
ncbi:prepilin-type N-terminal cleavage/methylation domain-containing protein [Haloimpatiens sp. FM7330]|uniref:prepilin-type N-terminal cleavage/methylation domain-containing protein n=1 Tax=Haloimpatiens sp. FM7330 TaxID=3298610 RepID=UPI00362C3051